MKPKKVESRRRGERLYRSLLAPKVCKVTAGLLSKLRIGDLQRLYRDGAPAKYDVLQSIALYTFLEFRLLHVNSQVFNPCVKL